MRHVLALLAVLAVAGCGAQKPAASAAEVAPASTYALIDGRLTPKLERALAFLPEAGEVRRLVGRAVAGTGAGPKPTLAVLDARGSLVVALTQNEIEDLQLPHARVRGWTVFSHSQAAVDAVRTAKRRANWAQPADGDLVFQKRNRMVTATDDGDHVVASRSEAPAGNEAEHPLAAAIPEEAVAAAAFHDGVRVLPALPFAGQLREGLGLEVSTLAAAAPGDGVLYARTGDPAASVTFIASGREVGRMRAIVRELAPMGPPPLPTRVDRVPAADVALGPVDLYYGGTGDTIFVTDDPGATVRPTDDALAPPHLPAKTRGWAYLDVGEGLPALESLAALAGTQLSEGFVRRVQGLRSVLTYRVRGRLVVSVT